MSDDLAVFVGSLFERCRQPACMTFSALDSVGTRPTPSRHVPLGNLAAQTDALLRLQAANRLGWGATVGVATRRAGLGRWSRGSRRDLVELPALFVDLDTPGSEALELLRSFSLPPSCIIHSGHGHHAYWFLASPTRDFEQADRALRGLAAFFDADPVLTIATSMRVPGTINTKRERAGALCRILELDPQRRYDLAQFTPYLAAAAPAAHTHRQTSASASSWQQAREGDLNPDLVRDVVDCLMTSYGGFLKPNGQWISALCPCGHSHDSPGRHFGFNPTTAVGMCFGRHGRMLLKDLCRAMKVDLRSYGWILKKKASA
jgi:hypothetical protein